MCKAFITAHKYMIAHELKSNKLVFVHILAVKTFNYLSEH